MKTRQGFVSNSSTTSFVAVCTEYKLDEFLEKIHYDEDDDEGMSCGCYFLPNDHLVVYGDGNNDPSFYGMDIEEHLKNDETVSAIKLKFKEIVLEKYGIDIPLEKIDFDFGEVGSG